MKKLALVIVTMLVTLSCNKGEELLHAIIIYSGPIAADGCEWLLTVDNVSYSPSNLDTAFKIDHLEVMVAFKITGDSFTCGNAAKYPVINIEEMKNH